ncbi:MAG: CrcB family protein [Chloroflexi bacterium]|nr:CrcB family protein [Chloroflexota bacterium]
MKLAFSIVLGGALGTLLRYGFGLLHPPGANGFPWATWGVNALGCFLFGLVLALLEKSFLLPPSVGQVLLTGMLGGFTTFSSFVAETRSLFSRGSWHLAVFNLVGEILVGLIAIYIGLSLGEWLIGLIRTR